ncbi:hypothetical protein [Glutamicibacter sp. NPDC087344]|uniref:hypothetical protein n=1 Tax=Glutamicibacter sp. NPDC087344 TaxID=3363994 RepID=UPI0037FEC4C3
MHTSDFTARLIVAINDTHTLINGGSVDAIALIMKGRALAKAFRPSSCTNDQVHHLAALMIASIAEAWISIPQSTEWVAYLNLCRRSHTELRRLQPYDCATIRTLWAIGNKADELAVMGVRVRSPRRPEHPLARPLQNRSYAEALTGYGDLPTEPEQAHVGSEEKIAARMPTGPDAEKQYFSAGEHWTNTGSK